MNHWQKPLSIRHTAIAVGPICIIFWEIKVVLWICSRLGCCSPPGSALQSLHKHQANHFISQGLALPASRNKQLCLFAFLLKTFFPVKNQNLPNLPCLFFFYGGEAYVRYQSASVQEYLGSLLNIYTWNAMCTFWKFYFEIQKEETPGGSRTRRQLLLLPLAWLINLCWSVQSVTSRRAIPAQDFEISPWKPFIF